MWRNSNMTNRSAILEHFVDVEKGIIPLVGEVNEELYAHLMACLLALRSSKREYDKITFVLNTYGGDLYQALAIHDLIKMQPMKTIIQCNGPVMSAGTVILQSADERVMTPRSYLMVHFGLQSADSSQCLNHFDELTQDIKGIYKARSGASSRIINTWFEKDTYYNAQQALKFGLIDRIADYEKEAAD